MDNRIEWSSYPPYKSAQVLTCLAATPVFPMRLLIAALALCLPAQGELIKDIEYAKADGVSLTLDASIPEGSGPFPAAILVHGGGFVAGDKQTYINYIFQPLSDAHIAWFSINYRLAPKYPFPAATDDVERAIGYVKANAAKYRIDSKRIALIGESAGGQMVAYVGARNRREAQIAAVVSMYGIHDFISMAVELKGAPHEILEFLGIKELNADTAAVAARASPITLVNQQMPPLLLIHGSKDEDVPYQQSVEMCDKMKQVGARCDLMTVNGVHGMDHWEPHPELHWYKRALVEWLQKTLK
jgi:acetyl esterase